ncbi:amidase, partial [Nocardia brasiliensis]|uniref:amidase n=1 Tax=Nocardia brasiliensis TaxID=37326 RepID=UPI002458F7D8
MNIPTEPAAMTAVQLVSAYAAGALSPVEATEAVLAAIAANDPAVNAYCLVDPDRALVQAKDSEARWHSGHARGLLDGVPISIKDIFLTEGWPTRRGSTSVDPAGPWTVDSPVAARLREDGMVFLGKTTTPEIAWKAVTDSPLTGITRNPVDPATTAGGSSGGSAAAVAGGMGPVSVGTDGGGSIRIPAAFCGIVGFKPTHGRIPLYPASPFGPLAHAGPMTRTVEDAALLMDILSLPDPRDPTSLAPTLTTFRGQVVRDVRGLTVAYSPTLGYAKVDPEVAALVDAAVRKLGEAELRVATADPGFADPREAFELLWAAGAATMLSKFPAGSRERVDPALGEVWDQGNAVRARAKQAPAHPAGARGLKMWGVQKPPHRARKPPMPLT